MTNKKKPSRPVLPDLASSYEFDVAFSFLSGDLSIAHDLQRRLEPELSTFVFDRNVEELLAGDGMSRFANVFRTKSRLHVVLYRDGWGQTDWTALEERHIKERALSSRWASLAIVALESNPQLPDWVPRFYLYLSDVQNSRAEAAAVIRARAMEVGAVPNVPSVAESVRKAAEEKQIKQGRQEFLSSAAGASAGRAEALHLLDEVERHVADLNQLVPELDLHTDFNRVGRKIGGTVRGGGRQLAFWWEQPFGHSLSNAHLQVGDFSPRATRTWTAHAFALTEDGEHAWRYAFDIGQGSSALLLLVTSDAEPIPTKRFVEQHMSKLAKGIIEDS